MSFYKQKGAKNKHRSTNLTHIYGLCLLIFNSFLSSSHPGFSVWEAQLWRRVHQGRQWYLQLARRTRGGKNGRTRREEEEEDAVYSGVYKDTWRPVSICQPASRIFCLIKIQTDISVIFLCLVLQLGGIPGGRLRRAAVPPGGGRVSSLRWLGRIWGRLHVTSARLHCKYHSHSVTDT